jgi:hypothetical protein
VPRPSLCPLRGSRRRRSSDSGTGSSAPSAGSSP